MTTAAFKKEGLTGGTSADLDSIDGANLADNDFAIVMVESTSTIYHYLMVESSGAAENSPLVIAPDTNAGNKRWILQGSSVITGDIDGQGNYAVDLQNFPDMLSKGPGYNFNGTDAVITIADNANIDVTTNDFYIFTVIRPQDVTRTTDYIINKEASGVGYGLYINQDDLYIRFDDGTNDVSAIIGTGVFSNDTVAVIFVTFDRSGNATVYINGNQVGTVDISSASLTLANAGNCHLGQDSAGGNEFAGDMFLMDIGNLSLTEAEVKAFSNGAAIPYKYLGASNTELVTSNWINGGSSYAYDTFDTASATGFHAINIAGADRRAPTVDEVYLVAGKAYRVSITTSVTSGQTPTFGIRQSFNSGNYASSSVELVSGATGEIEFISDYTDTFQAFFRSTEATEFTVSDFSIIQIGCTLDLNQSGITETQWLDASGNDLHGTVDGPVVTNRPNTSALNYNVQGETFSLDVHDFIHDDGAGNDVISTMAYIPKFITSGWPQAALNDLEVGGFFMDVYENAQPDATSTTLGSTAANTPGAIASVSKSGVVPWTGIDWLNARIAASNRSIDGRSCHMVTPFERFAVLSLIMKNGNWGSQRGNNNNGKDTRDTDTWDKYGITDPVQPAYRMLTGSGPNTWWHNGIPGRGIHNLVGNLYEWEDCRIESGYIQPKAYLAGATTAADTYIDYDDNAGGDAAYIHQLTPGIYTITDATNGNEDVTVERVIITGRFTGRLLLSAGMATDHIDNAVIQLKTAVDLCNGVSGAWVAIGKLLEDNTSKHMALPDQSDTTTHVGTLLDSWYKYDNSDSRAMVRCGYWGRTTKARSGLIVATNSEPTFTDTSLGFRAALSIGNQ